MCGYQVESIIYSGMMFWTDYLTCLVKNLYWMLTLNTMMMSVNFTTGQRL